MKYITKAVFIAALFFFSGCSVSETGVPINEISSEVDECEQSGSENCSIDGGAVQLELFISTPKPIDPASSVGNCGGVSHDRNTASDLERFTYCFDISGTCNEAGLESAVVVARTSFDGFVNSNIVGTCKRGRFHVQVQRKLANCSNENSNRALSRFDINHKFCAQHTIELELVGKKADGTEVRNEARAKKRIPFVVKQRPECDESLTAVNFSATCT